MGSSRRWPAVLLILGCISGCAGTTELPPSQSKRVTLVNTLAGRGELIALGSNQLLAILTAHRLVIVEPTQGDTMFATSSPTRAALYTDRALAFSADASMLAASVNGAVVVVDVRAKTVLVQPDPATGSRLGSVGGALAFSPDNRQLLTGGSHVYVMDLPSGHLSDSLSVSTSTAAISVLPDGRRVAIAGFDGSVQIWAWKEHAITKSLGNCEEWCSTGGTTAHYLVAGCGASSLRIWDSRSLRSIGVIRGHPFIGQEISTTRLDDLLITGSGPGTPRNPEGLTTSEILIFDLPALEPIASWRAHTAGGIYSVAAAPDGSLFATCGYDHVVNVWRLED